MPDIGTALRHNLTLARSPETDIQKLAIGGRSQPFDGGYSQARKG